MSAPRCCRCGWYIPAGSLTEEAHARRCRPPTRKAQRLAALRRELAEHSTLFPIVVRAREGIEPEQLRRVAEGRSDFAETTWRRLDPYLDVTSP